MSQFKIKVILIYCVFLLALTQTCESSIITINDPGFENSPNLPNSGFTPFGSAFPDDPAPGIDPSVEGAETLRLEGAGDAQFSGVFQDIFIDGVNITIGSQVVLSGIVGHTSADPLASLAGSPTVSNRAFLEVSFVDSSGNPFGAFQSPGIDSNSPTDVFVSEVTSVAIVPSNAVAVRVAAVFDESSLLAGDTISGSAFVDNLEVHVTVPEPTSGLVLAVGFLTMLARRRRQAY